MALPRTPSPSLIFIALVACTPSSSDAGSSETSGTSVDPTTESSTANTEASSETADPSATATTNAGDDTSTSTDASSSGGSVDTTGGEATMFGRYVLTAGGSVLTPRGCAARRGSDPTWSITLQSPAEDGTFAMHESFGAFDNGFDCAATPTGFTCDNAVHVDYGAMAGPDAVVDLTTHYDATWADPDAIAGTYDVAFSCAGTECDAVIDEWNVLGFPCDIAVSFTGALDPDAP